MEEIVVGSERRRSEGQPQQPQSQSQSQSQQQRSFQQYQPPPPNDNTSINGRPQPQKRYQLIDGEWVQLTAAGVPRKKPGRKPGSVVKPKTTTPTGDGSDQTKARKPRKSRDPDAPPIQRKRKLAPASDAETEVSGSRPLAPAGSGTASPSPSMQPLLGESLAQRHQPHHAEQRYSPKMPKREGYPGSMQSILNADPPQASPPNHTGSTAIPVRTSGQSYDPIRGNYDPVRETMTSHSHNHYSSTSGSPRGLAATQATHRSPSIASLIEPQASTKASPSHAYQHTLSQPRLQHQEASSMPPSPSYAPKPVSTPTQTPQHISQETVKEVPPPAPPVQRPVINQANFTTIANGPVKRVSPKQKPTAGASTPKTDNLDDIPHEGEERSILDFGKARPGEEAETPTIVLTIPITSGETNKYVNFMRMAEDRYGWDALHPRLAANRDRKARIAAAAASLEKTESGRESGDEMSVDLSDGEGSNPENGGTSGADAQAKPKKKRNFKEDQYDVHDDFVDDSELLWEAQAAASRDGFFVYSGPLVPEVEKPAAGYVFIILFPPKGSSYANSSIGKMDLPNVAGAAEAAVAEVEELQHVVEQAVVAVADRVLVAVQLQESLASQSPRRLKESARKLSGSNWQKQRLTDMCYNRRHPLSLYGNWEPSIGQNKSRVLHHERRCTSTRFRLELLAPRGPKLEKPQQSFLWGKKVPRLVND